jgi:hypothetical protein
MYESGMSISVLPTKANDGTHSITISHSVWEGDRLVTSDAKILTKVRLNLTDDGQPDNMLWMIDILQVVEHLMVEKFAPLPARSVRRAYPSGQDTTVNPSHPYLR